MRPNAAPRSSVMMLDAPTVEGDSSITPKENHMDSVVAGKWQKGDADSGVELIQKIKNGENVMKSILNHDTGLKDFVVF